MRQSFAARAKAHPHPLVRRLFSIIESKKSNLAISADLTTSKELIQLADSKTSTFIPPRSFGHFLT
jgi:hypothetical protein